MNEQTERAEMANDELVRLREELESVKKQAAAMREALIFAKEVAGALLERNIGDFQFENRGDLWKLQTRSEAAIQADAGRDFISRESVKPLVDRLRDVQGYFEAIREHTAGIGEYTAVNAKIESLTEALEHARTLGL